MANFTKGEWSGYVSDVERGLNGESWREWDMDWKDGDLVYNGIDIEKVLD